MGGGESKHAYIDNTVTSHGIKYHVITAYRDSDYMSYVSDTMMNKTYYGNDKMVSGITATVSLTDRIAKCCNLIDKGS